MIPGQARADPGAYEESKQQRPLPADLHRRPGPTAEPQRAQEQRGRLLEGRRDADPAVHRSEREPVEDADRGSAPVPRLDGRQDHGHGGHRRIGRVYALVGLGETELAVKPMRVAGVLLGSLVFGTGMAVLGYCPGTGVAACAEGRRDAWVGVLGMFAGALTFVAAKPLLEPVILSLGDLGKITLPELTGTSPWLWIGGLVLAGVVALVATRRPH